MAEELVAEEGAAGEEHQPDHRPAGPFGGHVEHHQEEAEEEQAGAEVALEDQDAEADHPHRQDRTEVAAARQVEEEEPTPGQGQRVAVQHQVAGDRDHQQHLGDLAGLEAERADPDPDLGAEVAVAQARDQRQQQQHHRGQRAGVGEPLEHPVVADQHHRADEEPHPEGHPDQLLLGEVVGAARGLLGQVEPVDDRQAEAVERGDHREQHGVGVRGEEAEREVGGQHQGGQPAAVADQVDRHLAVDPQADGRVRPDAHREGEHEQEELRAPPTAVHESHQGSGLAHGCGSAPRRVLGVWLWVRWGGGALGRTRLSPGPAGGQVVDGLLGLLQVVASMPSRTWLASYSERLSREMSVVA